MICEKKIKISRHSFTTTLCDTIKSEMPLFGIHKLCFYVFNYPFY